RDWSVTGVQTCALPIFINIHLPPLRNRKEDILPLAQHFIRKYNEENGRVISDQIAPEVLKALESYSWPGNVRELETALERAVIEIGRASCRERGSKCVG